MKSWAGPPLSYTTNGVIGWNGSSNQLYGVMGMVQPSWVNPGVTPMAAVTRPSDTIMIAERFSPTNFIYFGTNADAMISGCCWGTTMPDGTKPVDKGTPFGFDNQSNHGGVTPLHGGGANFTFVDGHTKWMHADATNPDPKNRPLDNMWNAYR